MVNELHDTGHPGMCPPPQPPPQIKVRRSKSATLYLRVLDARKREPGRFRCARCAGEIDRDRRYGFPKRYGLRTTVTTRRVDRVDPIRQLY